MPQNREFYNELPPKHALEISNWQHDLLGQRNPKDLETIAAQVVFFSREARNAPNIERVSPIPISLSEFSDLVKPDSDLSTDIATHEIYKWAVKDKSSIEIWTPSSPPKIEEILEAMYSFRNLNPGSVLVWISGKGKTYPEARINIYQTIKVNGEKYLFMWGIPSQHSDEECLVFNHRLSRYFDGERKFHTVADIEDLRVSPIPVRIPEIARPLTNFWEDQIPQLEVWTGIASGQIIVETIQELIKGKPLLRSKYQKILEARSEEERRQIGAEIEIAVQDEFDIRLRNDGHGPLYSLQADNYITNWRSLLGMSSYVRPQEIVSSSKKEHCGACGRFRKGEELRGECDFK